MVAGKPNRPIGAELRGTGKRVWRGLAPGTSKNAGYFWIGDPSAQHIVLCESAIDAISCYQLHAGCQNAQLGRTCLCISTAGVRPDAPWLPPLLARGYQIYCGFDADQPGETASRQMITRHRLIQRLRPPGHDWNDVLTAPSKITARHPLVATTSPCRLLVQRFHHLQLRAVWLPGKKHRRFHL